MPEQTIDPPDEQADSTYHHVLRGRVDRRWMLRGGAGLAAGAVLAACGDDGDSSSGDTESSATEPPDEDESGGGGAAAALATTADVPVGGGAIFGEGAEGVVLTQPTEGEFKAFTSVCTHNGCQVNEVTDTINCPCHGSMFSIEDGSPVGGPAPSALEEKQITVAGDEISLA